MMVTQPAILGLVLLAQASAADSLYRLAQRLPESGLVLEARARPLAVREAVSDALARVVRTPAESEQALEVSRRLARAHAEAWQDPFLTIQVERFARAPPARRIAKVRADSLRRAGVTAYSRDGAAAAIALWERALAGYRAIDDSAGIAGTMDNIGAGLVQLGRLGPAESYLTRAHQVARAIGDLRVQANSVGHLGDLSAERGEVSKARERYTEALRLRERIGDSRGIAADHNNLGLLAQELGDLEEARRRFEDALARNRQEGRPELAATNLLNLAGLASIEGDFSRAASFYRDAYATWQAREEWAEAAAALHGLGLLELRRGNYLAARQALLQALEIYQRTGSPSDVVVVRRALADALAAAGSLQAAVDQLFEAQEAAESAGVATVVLAGLSLARADLAVRLNALGEAERRYREAERLYRDARDSEGEAEARQGLGLLALSQENTPQAEALLSAAVRSQVAAQNRRGAALTRLGLGWVSWKRKDTVEARRRMAQAARELDGLGDPVASAEAIGERAALEAEAGAASAAEALYRSALQRLEGRIAPETWWRLRAGLGLTLKSRGALDAAARELRAAIEALEQPRRALLLPERRSAFLADKWETYAQLALLERSRGLTGSAFEVSERLRAREMLELLAQGRIPAAADPSGDLVSREQDLRRRIAELSRDVNAQTQGSEPVRGPDLSLMEGSIRQALLRAQEEYADLLLRLRERVPRHAAVVAPRTATWRDVARRLDPEQAFVTYLLSDSGSVAFVVVRDSLAAVELGVGRQELKRLVEFARGALELQRTDSLWRGPFRRLWSHLIAPLEETGLLAGKSHLVVVPHAELHYLPFGALLSGEGAGGYLSSRYQLTLAPSASVWLALGDRPPRSAARGVLAFAPRPDALPASRREVAAVERLAGVDVQVRIGRTATEDEFRREVAGRRIIHLATYGVLNKHNPLFSFVELQPGREQDGRLEVHEVFGLELAAELVVLSACQTALGSGALADLPPGDDWVGLTRAFLHAGADKVVATLWPVDDWATAAFMERFYQALARGLGAARSLREAQTAFQAEPTTSNPYYWAGFVLVAGADAIGP